LRRLGLGSIAVLLVLALGLLWASVLAFVAIAMAVHGLTFAAAQRMVTSDPLPLGAAQLAALAATIALGVWLGTPGETPRHSLGITPSRSRVLVTALLAGLALQLPMIELMTALTHAFPLLARPPEVDRAVEQLARIDTPVRAITVPFALVAVPAVTEELLFRGLILRALRERHGAALAVVVSAVLFGLFHGERQALIFATLMGLIFGVLAVRARSTLPGIAMHAGFNALPVFLQRDVVSIAGFNDGSNADVPWPWWVASGLVSIALLALLAWLLREPPKTNQVS
jgi:membrane protease YdiL (CAAX protease family)